MDDFDKFWKAYPRKLAKGDARKAWQQMQKVMPSLEALLTAISIAKETEQWRKDGGAYIPYPATWLRGERWEDEHEVEIVPMKVEQPKISQAHEPAKPVVKVVSEEQAAENRKRIAEMMKQMTRGA